VNKHYVDVILRHRKSGDLVPMYVCWDNGISYRVDRILGRARRFSRAGGCGVRYTCVIQGHCRYLFLEKDRWFIESERT
jgi:hypothetical protein